MERGLMLEQEESVDVEYLQRIHYYQDLIKISPAFFERLEDFTKRNDLRSSNSTKVICSRCFKAFLSTLMEEFDVPDPLRMLLLCALDCPTGHEGYYIDGSDLKKIK